MQALRSTRTRYYQVAPRSKEQMGDLQWQEFNGEMRNALIVSGFNVPPTIQTEPEVMVLLTYVIQPRTYTQSIANSGSKGTTTMHPRSMGCPNLDILQRRRAAEFPERYDQSGHHILPRDRRHGL